MFHNYYVWINRYQAGILIIVITREGKSATIRSDKVVRGMRAPITDKFSIRLIVYERGLNLSLSTEDSPFFRSHETVFTENFRRSIVHGLETDLE